MSAAARPTALQGELTIACAAEQRLGLLAAVEAAQDTLVLEASGVQACDSAGIQLLLAARRSLADRGLRLRLVHPSPVLQQALDTYALHALLGPA